MAMEARRMSANFEPSVWDDKYIQSLTTSYLGEKCVAETEKLKTQVKLTTDEAEDEPAQLELIDNLQRLDLCSRFKDRIAKILVKIYEAEKSSGDEDECMKKDLHLTSLKFRLLRQHGFHVPQEVFCSFMDELGNFKDCAAEDVRGLISLYEASFLSMEGESILDLAKDFSSNHLTRKLEDVGVAEEVKHALELLLHWRMQKLEALWFIKVYQNRSDANTHLLQLSKLDFNMVQATHQHELKRVSRWDINSLDRLPEYKRISFLALFNFANELAYHILRDQGFNVISHLGDWSSYRSWRRRRGGRQTTNPVSGMTNTFNPSQLHIRGRST